MRSLPPVTRFLLFTFSLSWGLWLIGSWQRGIALNVKLLGADLSFPLFPTFLLLGTFCPGFVALFMAETKEGPSSLWARLKKWRLPLRWYFAALFLPVGICGVAILGHLSTEQTWFFRTDLEWWFAQVLFNLLLAPFWEELGWRGFLLPKLLQQRSAAQSALIVGVAWGLWHLPVRWETGGGSLSAFAWFSVFWFNAVCLSVVFTWLYIRTDGALLPAMLLHSVYNASMSFLVSPTLESEGFGLFLWLAASLAGAALICYRSGAFDLKTPGSVAHLPNARH